MQQDNHTTSNPAVAHLIRGLDDSLWDGSLVETLADLGVEMLAQRGNADAPEFVESELYMEAIFRAIIAVNGKAWDTWEKTFRELGGTEG